MTGEERRREIIKTMRELKEPVSGATLARKYKVSRQVIVQDIALLRAMHYGVVSTARGYQLKDGDDRAQGRSKDDSFRRVFHVSHTDAQIEEELNTIVDNGGKVLDVFVEHAVYGPIRADLKVSCRRHVQDFLEDIQSGKSSPLKNLTSGIHFHTVAADSEETLDIIEGELKKRGYLL